jgi:hypothetical protein
LACGGLVPGQFCEDKSHAADIGQSGKCKSCTNKCGESVPAGVQEKAEGHSGENEESGTEADLAIQRPSGLSAGNYGTVGGLPGDRSAIENFELWVLVLDQLAGHPSATSGLADENNVVFVKIRQSGFDLIHRDIDCAGDVSRREFGGATDINELGFGRARLELVELLKCDVHCGVIKGESIRRKMDSEGWDYLRKSSWMSMKMPTVRTK